ncbi:MAG: hypothetical protein EA408_12460 [Marinilabiliales bacterium]|nr:MAG: hypothetical protein EA408_12460 [Marinilabiliales bacterium]
MTEPGCNSGFTASPGPKQSANQPAEDLPGASNSFTGVHNYEKGHKEAGRVSPAGRPLVNLKTREKN